MPSIDKFENNRALYRRISQILTLIFIIAVPLLNKNDINIIIGTLYSMSIGNLDITDPALIIQTILLSKTLLFSLLIAGLIPVLLAYFFGRVFCSWSCPYHLFYELAHFFKKLIYKNNAEKHINPKGRIPYFTLSGIFVLVLITGIPLISYLSFPGLFSSLVADYLYFGILGLEFYMIFIILIIEIFFTNNFWCKYICPVGNTLGLIHNTSISQIEVNSDECKLCLKQNESPCISVCPFNLNPKQQNLYPYCTHCFKCIDECHRYGKALQFTLTNNTINKTTK